MSPPFWCEITNYEKLHWYILPASCFCTFTIEYRKSRGNTATSKMENDQYGPQFGVSKLCRLRF